MIFRIKDLSGRVTKRVIKQNVCDNHYRLIRMIKNQLNIPFSKIHLFDDNYVCITESKKKFINFVFNENMVLLIIIYEVHVRVVNDNIIYNDDKSWYIDEMEKSMGAVEKWDTSWITNMNYAFYNNHNFNKNINKWDVSSVTSMKSMFRNTTSFNRPLSEWRVSNVRNTESMFENAVSFNASINNWNVSNIINVKRMFYNATTFNQPLYEWKTSNFKNVKCMFVNADSFDQSVEMWNLSNAWGTFSMFSIDKSLSKTCPNNHLIIPYLRL